MDATITFGTDGYGRLNRRETIPYVITVGAVNTKATPDRSDDVMTSYSAKGPTAIDRIVKPDIVAPGNRVVSLYAPGQLEVQNPQNQVPLSYYRNDWQRRSFQQLLRAERDQYGGGDGQRRGGTDGAERSDPDARPDQSAADENRIQEACRAT